MKIDYAEAEKHIRKQVVYVLGDRHPDLDDVVQNTLIRVFKSGKDFRGDAQFSTWVRMIANNQAKSFVIRKNKKTINVDYEKLASHLFSDEDPVDSIEPTNEYQLVMEALPMLSRKVRLSIKGTLEGKSSEQLCKELDVNENALYRLRGKGKKQLKKLLGKKSE